MKENENETAESDGMRFRKTNVLAFVTCYICYHTISLDYRRPTPRLL